MHSHVRRRDGGINMGKTKIEDADITLEEAIVLLEHPPAEKSPRAGSIDYRCGFEAFSLDEVRPAEMVPFVKERFTSPWGGGYVTVRHEAYLDSRNAGVEHVLNLEYGSIIATFGEKSVKGEPFRHATLKFSTATFAGRAGPVPSDGKRPEQEYTGGVIGAVIRLGERILGPLPDGTKGDAQEPQDPKDVEGDTFTLYL